MLPRKDFELELHMYEHDRSSEPGHNPNVRASDADREAMADRLRNHHAEGRLDTDEFQERLDSCFQAKTVGELDQLLNDMPREVSRSQTRGRFSARRLWPLPLLPILIAVIVAGAVGGHHGHAGFWVVIPVLVLARFILWPYRSFGLSRNTGLR